jgi:hypothetical protein
MFRTLAGGKLNSSKQPEFASNKKLTCKANGLVDKSAHYYLDVTAWNNAHFIPLIKSSAWVLFKAPSQSGKTTRVYNLAENNQEYKFITVDFQHVDSSQLKAIIPSTATASITHEMVANHGWDWLFGRITGAKCIPHDVEFVLILDEFDAITNLEDKRAQVLCLLQALKQSPIKNKADAALTSVIAISNHFVTTLDTDFRSSSPFNVSEVMEGPYWKLDEVTQLMALFEEDTGVKVPKEIISLIY